MEHEIMTDMLGSMVTHLFGISSTEKPVLATIRAIYFCKEGGYRGKVVFLVENNEDNHIIEVPAFACTVHHPEE